MSSGETSAVSTFGMVEGLPDSDGTVLFHCSPQLSPLLSLLFPCRTAGSSENIPSVLCQFRILLKMFGQIIVFSACGGFLKKLTDKKAHGTENAFRLFTF